MARQVLDNGVILPSEYSDDWYDDMTSNLTKLDEVIGSDAEKLSASDVGAAAISNDYDDLDDKPAYNILRRASVTLTAGGTGNYTDLDSDSKIKAGDYVLDAANKLYSITAIDAANSTYTVSAAALINITDKSELGAAALSNSYDDLSNLPGYGILRFCSTAITDNSGVAFANISSVSKIAAGDFLLDTAAKLYQIASIDTANETVSVTTPLTQLAVDSGVMHLSGNEKASGTKDFSDIVRIYNSDSSSNTAQLWLKNSKVNRGQPVYGDQIIWFRDAHDKVVTALISRVTTAGASALMFQVYNVDQDNQQVSNYLSFVKYLDGSCYLLPDQNDVIVLGSSATKFKSVNTNLINGLAPSSMILPNVNINSFVDISGYFTNTGTGETNTYPVIANGWIYLRLSNISECQAEIYDSSNNRLYAVSTSGSIEQIMIPVVSGVTFKTQWATGSAVTVNIARFIPCQGNI